MLNLAGASKCSLLNRLLALAMALLACGAFAQTPAISEAPLDQLVGPIALYPDDLVGIILPASTYPLEIVQADRFLDKRKSDQDLKVNEGWQDAVKSLLNYPDVVKKMSTDLDWTTDLGEAVVADQGAVLEAVQRYRRQVQAAGNLKSDDKQTIIVEKEVVQIVQANPEVIYVPQYTPETMVVAGGYSSYGYYPAPYPVYYYPYAPGAALVTGLIWGAAITAAWNGGHYVSHYGGGNNSINVNRNTNINTGNINSGNINRNSGPGTAWKSDKKPGQVSGAVGRSATTARAGDLQGAGGARAANLPEARSGAGGNERASTSAAVSDRGAPNRSSDAFGGYGSGNETRSDSSRGAASRESMSSSGRGQSFQGGGGRSSFGGGGGRGGRR